MIFEDGGMVVVQEMDIGGYMAMIPTEKIEVLTDYLDQEDIGYEMAVNRLNIDDRMRI